MNRWKYVLVGLLVGAFAFPLVWNSDPSVIGQTVTVDSTQSPLVVNAAADLADLTPTDGQSVIIKTGAEKGLWYYDKDSATATGVSVLNGPGSVGRFLVINNDAGSVAAATAITAAEITDDGLLELQAFDGSSAKSLTIEELKKTGVQVYNVKQYGATGNGVADDTAEIQAAIDAALTGSFHLDNNTGGPIVFIPPGDYAISVPLLLDTTLGNKITIVGSGPNISRIVRHTSFTGSVMLTSNTDVTANPGSEDRILYGCTLRDFGLFCRNGASDVDVGILFKTMAHSRIERVWISYPDKVGVIVDWGYTNNFDQVRVDNSGLHGFVMGLGTCEIANQYTFTNCVAVGCGEIGYYFNGGLSYVMNGCNAEQCSGTGVYTNRVHGLQINGSYFEGVGATGIGFTTAYGSAIQGGTWTAKANIVINGTNGGINSTTYAVPLDVSNAFPTEGVKISGHTYHTATDVSFVAFVGCDGVNIDGYSSNGATTVAPDFLFNASYTLATNININNHGGANKKLDAVSLYDTARNFYTAKFANIVIQDVDFPIINVPVSRLTMVEASSGGTLTPTSFTYGGSMLYRLGSTASDGQVTDCYGSTINMGQYPHLRGKYATVVIEWLPGFGYNDVYASLYNGGAQVQFYTEYNSNSVTSPATGEVATTGTISAGSPTLTVASATGLAIGDFVQISEAGSGATPASHFARITNISGTTVTLSDNAVASVTSKTVRTAVPRISYQTIQIPSTVESVKFGIRRYLGRKEDAIYVAKVSIVPFGVQWPYNGSGVLDLGQVETSTAGSGSPNILVADESRKTLTNEGTTAANYHTLPTAVAGLTYTFVVQDADGLRITAATGDTIRLGPNVTATAGYIESTTIGDVVTVTAINATEWVGHAYGTWTNGTWSYALADTP